MSQPEDLSITLSTAVEQSAKGISLGERCVAATASESHGDGVPGDADHYRGCWRFSRRCCRSRRRISTIRICNTSRRSFRRCSKTLSTSIGRQSRRHPQTRLAELQQKRRISGSRAKLRRSEVEDGEHVMLRPYRDAGFPTVGRDQPVDDSLAVLSCSARRIWRRSPGAMSSAAMCSRACFGGPAFRSSWGSWRRSCRW